MIPTEPIKPQLEHIYADNDGRRFIVKAIEAANPQGREVQGKLYLAGVGAPSDYSCNLEIFGVTWQKDITNTHRDGVEKPVASIATGEICNECGGTMQRTGTCMTCPQCGSNTGCG